MTREGWCRDRGLIYRGVVEGMHVADFDPNHPQTRDDFPKASWKPGPWHTEPDYAQWETRAGLLGLIVRGPRGALCGYVGLPRHADCVAHPEIAAACRRCQIGRAEEDEKLSCHGGLTYASTTGGGLIAVYSKVELYLFWHGFDCAHAGDYCPKDSAISSFVDREGQPTGWGTVVTYRDFNYVRAEVERLAAYLAEVKT